MDAEFEWSTWRRFRRWLSFISLSSSSSSSDGWHLQCQITISQNYLVRAIRGISKNYVFD